MMDSWTPRETCKQTSRQALKQIDRQVDRQANRHTSNISLIATRGVPYTAPLCSQWKNDLTPSNATDFIPWCEAERGLTSVQLYLSIANIAWHEKGREWSLSTARNTGPKISQWNIVLIMSCCMALCPQTMYWGRRKQGARLHYGAQHSVSTSLT